MVEANKKYIQLTVLVSFVVGFLIHFPELVSLTDALEQETLFPGMSPVDVLFEVGYTFLSLLILFTVNTFLFGFNNPAVHTSWWKVFASFVLTWLLSKLLGELFVYMHRNFQIPAIDAMVHHYLHPVRDFIISLIVTDIQNQYQALKNQLNPHMLFNSLNTLQSLVRENPEKAQDYIRELSRVLRYTLQENDTHTVTLREEMSFVDAYIFLMKMRYEDNLHFKIEVDERMMVPNRRWWKMPTSKMR